MSKYVITFSKLGYVKFISHLDMNRLFRRSIRKAGIELAYSKGFNPHPKMNFAQPLSLGYTATNEMLEITTIQNYKPWYIKSQLEDLMPEGIKIIDCDYIDDDIKSISALAEEAIYEISFKIFGGAEIEKIVEDYLDQSQIIIKKLNKKKKMVDIDIRERIRSIDIKRDEDDITLIMKLDCGSASNLSPEYVISTLIDFGKLGVKRESIDVCRREVKLSKELRF